MTEIEKIAMKKTALVVAKGAAAATALWLVLSFIPIGVILTLMAMGMVGMFVWIIYTLNLSQLQAESESQKSK